MLPATAVGRWHSHEFHCSQRFLCIQLNASACICRLENRGKRGKKKRQYLMITDIDLHTNNIVLVEGETNFHGSGMRSWELKEPLCCPTLSCPSVATWPVDLNHQECFKMWHICGQKISQRSFMSLLLGEHLFNLCCLLSFTVLPWKK